MRTSKNTGEEIEEADERRHQGEHLSFQRQRLLLLSCGSGREEEKLVIWRPILALAELWQNRERRRGEKQEGRAKGLKDMSWGPRVRSYLSRRAQRGQAAPATLILREGYCLRPPR